jgi:hypothetical protein
MFTVVFTKEELNLILRALLDMKPALYLNMKTEESENQTKRTNELIVKIRQILD